MEKRINVSKTILVAVVMLLPAFLPALADYGYGGESQIKSFFDGTSGFLVKTVGTGVSLFGLIGAGIKITATGDRDGLGRAIMVMIGGIIILLSKSVIDLLSKFAGGSF